MLVCDRVDGQEMLACDRKCLCVTRNTCVWQGGWARNACVWQEMLVCDKKCLCVTGWMVKKCLCVARNACV